MRRFYDRCWLTLPSRRRLPVVGACLFLALACGTSSVRQAALKNDLPTLQREIRAAQERGEMDEDAAKGVAEAVIERELESTSGDALVARVRDVRGCIGSVENELDEVSERRDPGGGAAMLALLEAGRSDADDLVELYADDADPSWRAVGARAALGDEHSRTRQRLLIDPDLRVRRAAAHAARAEPVAEDREVLIETARLDPDPLVRSLAVQTLGKIGGQEVVQALVDLWPRSETATRQIIADAWGEEASFRNGGEERLLATLERERGLAALVAARGLIQRGSQHAKLAEQILVRAVGEGPQDERALAIRFVPLNEPGVTSVVEATKSEDAQVSVVAAARLASLDKHQKAANEVLRKLAKDGSPRVRQQAEAALAQQGDRTIIAALKERLSAPSSDSRRQAAFNLIVLGEYGVAATSLGDEVAEVRTRVACAMLAQR